MLKYIYWGMRRSVEGCRPGYKEAEEGEMVEGRKKRRKRRGGGCFYSRAAAAGSV